MISTAFFGTEKFAAGILEALIASGEFDITLVITQPDRPIGRKQEMHISPVKEIALKYNLEIAQPETKQELTKYQPEVSKLQLAIVCQYGLIISKEIVDAPKLGSINVHPSLLPKYRGASPIQSALINGETNTGVSIMIMDEKMDHGPILSQTELPIAPDDTYETLAEKLLQISQPQLIETASAWVNEESKPKEQDHSQATFCKMFNKEDGRVDWQNKTAKEIFNLYRGLKHWPGVWTIANDARFKLLEIKPSTESVTPGVIAVINKQLLVGAKEGSVEILEIQPEGKKAMPAVAFINGHKHLSRFE